MHTGKNVESSVGGDDLYAIDALQSIGHVVVPLVEGVHHFFNAFIAAIQSGYGSSLGYGAWIGCGLGLNGFHRID
ncbi:hypothetical protein lpg0071 [Legionella pneumophila subsp. pneumophila str. Philadelphia 1]|uniref:Uncharacterized protein n=1 Tax=Legionella pneumophila subsp. pneumophila (strain Philadelphia 1 / ATCC 33152 / DSM 7513) TaxID=272624 RepID=Q5ZZE0_LEGPH|nr:hypothetical protein lpg0071 [Legionella pneumophila subsp. pneumophila str. Philadelphia 1]AEW50359.1 hypothetical protein lp12_0072 [Legionella pneumophila subsp. pneumophila ATCC 43290]